MNKKEIVISAKLDSSEFNKEFEQIKNKAAQIASSDNLSKAAHETRSKAVEMGLGRPLTEAEKRKADIETKQAIRDMEKIAENQLKQFEKTEKHLKFKEDQLKKLKNLEDDLLKKGKEDAQLKEQIIQKENELIKLREKAKTQLGEINKTVESIQNLQSKAVDTGMPGGGGDRKGPGIMGGIGAILKTVAPVMAVNKLFDVLDFAISYERQVREKRAASAIGFLGSETEAMFTGRYGEESLFTPEKMLALSQAKKESDDIAKAKRLAAYGAMGTGAAGIITANVPALAVSGFLAYKAGMEGFFPESDYSKAERERRMAELYQRNLEINKNLDPIRSTAIRMFGQRYLSDLQFQRMLGIGNETFRGGFLPQILGAGFTDEAGMRSAAAIMQAGGGSQVARESALTSLRFQRQFDLTNADQIIGLLGRTLGTGAKTDQALIKLYAEGTAQGMNKSELGKQLEGIAQLSAAMVARTSETVAKIGESVRVFTSSYTPSGVEGGLSAYQEYLRLTGEASGITGVGIRYQRALTGGDPNVSKKMREFASKSRENQIMLRTLLTAEGEIDELDPRVQVLMRETGLTYDEIVRQTRFGRASLITASGGGEAAIGKIAQIAKESGLVGKELKQKIMETDPRLLATAMSQLEYSGVLSRQMDAQSKESMVLGIAAERAMIAPIKEGASEKQVKKTLESEQYPRLEDKMVAQSAQGLSILNDEIRKLANDLSNHVLQIKNAREMLNIMTRARQEAATPVESNGDRVIRRAIDIFGLFSDDTQPTTSAPQAVQE